MSTEVLLAILGVIGGLAGTIRWLLGYYFKAAKELEDFKTGEIAKTIALLKSVTAEHSTSLNLVDARMKDVEKKMDYAISRFAEMQQANTGVKNAVQDFVINSEKRFHYLEENVEQIGKDLFLIKSTKLKGE